MLLNTVNGTGMLMANAMGNICSGDPTRVQVQVGIIQQSTLDYVICSPSLATHIRSLVIDTNQMDSDHRPLVLSLGGLLMDKPENTTTREVWNTSQIPSPPRRLVLGARMSRPVC